MISPSGYLQIVLQARGIAGHSVVEALNDMAASGGNSQSPRLALQDEQLARIGPALGGLVTHDENRIDGSVAIQILIGLRHHLIVLGDQARQFLRRAARRLRRKCASGVPSLRPRSSIFAMCLFPHCEPSQCGRGLMASMDIHRPGRQT